MNFRSYQNLVLVGRLGQNARLMQTKNGAEMLSFSVATTESLRNQDGSFDQRTSWHDCLMFGPRAPKLADKLTTGTLVCVQAHLTYRELTVGTKKYQLASVIVDDLQLLAASASAQQGQTAAQTAPVPTEPAAAPAPRGASAGKRPYANRRTVPAQSAQSGTDDFV